jgi:hypothetical protein
VELRRKRLRPLAALVIEQVFSKRISKGLDHVPMLSKLDNVGKPTFPARGGRRGEPGGTIIRLAILRSAAT